MTFDDVLFRVEYHYRDYINSRRNDKRSFLKAKDYGKELFRRVNPKGTLSITFINGKPWRVSKAQKTILPLI